MKKIYLLLIPVLMIIFSTKVYAATSSYKNNPINNITTIKNDCQAMGIDYSYYKNIDDSDYNRTDIIGLWEYYYDDGSIDLFVYLYNPYIGESNYNKILYYKNNLRFKEAYLYYEGNNNSDRIDLRGLDLELISIDNQISKYRYNLRNKDVNLSTMYSRKYEINSIEYKDLNNESIVLNESPFLASFINSSSDGDTINVDFEYDGYMFIFEKEAFRIYADLSNYHADFLDRIIRTFKERFSLSSEYVSFLPEMLSFNFNIPKEYNVIDINEITFSYRYCTWKGMMEFLAGGMIDCPDYIRNNIICRLDNVEDKIVNYKKDDVTSVKGKYLDTEIEFKDLKRIDNNKNRYNEKILNQEYIKTNLIDFYNYEWSLIFETSLETFTEYDALNQPEGVNEYYRVYHDATKMTIARMNYTDSNGETHNVIVNQGAAVDETTPLPYNPLKPQSFWEWLWWKITEFYTWLFGVVGADTFIKKAITVAVSILMIPLVLYLIPIFIKLILQLVKIVASFIKSIFKSIFKRKRE